MIPFTYALKCSVSNPLETVTDFIFLGSKITADGDCSHEIKRHLLPGRKVMTNLDSILKSRDITLPTKIHLVKAMFFPVIMYVCESWTIKKAEGQRIDAFELWYWRRLLRVTWTSRRSNQSILKEISPEYLLEALMLKLQYFGHLMKRADSLEKNLLLGKIEGGRRRDSRGWDGWMVSPIDGHEFEQAPGDDEGQGSLACCSPWGHKELDTVEQLNWTELTLSTCRSSSLVKPGQPDPKALLLRLVLQWPLLTVCHCQQGPPIQPERGLVLIKAVSPIQMCACQVKEVRYWN